MFTRMYVRDLVGNEYVCQATTTHNLSLNGEQSLSFTLEYTKPNAVFIDNIAEMWEVVDDNDVEHKIVLVSKKAQGDRPFVEVRAVPLFFDSFDSLRIYDEYNEHMTATRAFSLIFEDTPFNYILVGNFAAVEWEGFGAGEPRLETFKRALERYKAEFRIVGNTVYIEELIGRDTQFMYRHRLNASNIVVETDATGYWTYAKGYGDFGNEGTGDGESSDWKDAKLTDEYTSPLAGIPGIGVRHGPPIKDGRITDKTTMQNSLKALVDGSLKISISADIHDLRRQGYALGQPELGDRVFVIDERIGLHEEVRVSNIDITKDWRGNVLDLNLTIGSPSVVKRHQANISTAIKQITEIVEGVRKIPYNVLDNAIIEATKALQNAQTELQFTTNGILAIDKNDPNMVTLMNSAGLGVSRDGGATFRNAITGFGINADVITAGTMLANRIAGGILTSLNGNTEFDLNEGKLTMQNTVFELGGGADIRFTSRSNNLYYENSSVYAGIKFDHSLSGGGRPIAAFGVSDNNLDVNHSSWNGLRVHSGWVENNVPGVMTNIVSNELWLSEDPDHLSGGWRIQNKYDGTKARSLYGTGSFPYNLGTDTSIFSKVYTNNLYSAGGMLFKSTWNDEIGWNMKLAYEGDSHIRFYPQYTGNYYYSVGGPNNRVETGYFNQLRGVSVGSSSNPYNYVYTDSLIEGSDVDIKEDINENILGLDFINDINTVDFKLKDGTTYKVGVIAQELLKSLNDHGVSTNKQSMVDVGEVMGVSYTQLITPTIKSIQELTKKVIELENKLKEVEGKD